MQKRIFSKITTENSTLIEGIIWNYGSLIILSVSGFLFNILIAHFYNASALGVFNRVYAWYCVLSQITVWGIHMSVIKLVPEQKNNISAQKKIVLSALIPVFCFSSVTVLTAELALPYIVTDNNKLLLSMQLAIPGLIFFSLNKVLLNYINGLSEMKAYAVFQSLRYIAITLVIFLCGILKKDSIWLSFSFTIAEIVVFASSGSYLLKKKLLGKHFNMTYIKKHLLFGTRILPANMVLELNTKVDIICLGFILKDDYLIGIYSFSILFVEGFYQLYITIRRSINPKITEYFVDNKLQSGIEEINLSLEKYLHILSPVALALLSMGYCAICYILDQQDYLIGLKYLIIICLAIVINGRKIIWGNLFAQTGYPIYESTINTITVAANFLFNILLIYQFGLLGAAIATAFSHMIFGAILKYSAKKELQIHI